MVTPAQAPLGHDTLVTVGQALCGMSPLCARRVSGLDRGLLRPHLSIAERLP